MTKKKRTTEAGNAGSGLKEENPSIWVRNADGTSIEVKVKTITEIEELAPDGPCPQSFLFIAGFPIRLWEDARELKVKIEAMTGGTVPFVGYIAPEETQILEVPPVDVPPDSSTYEGENDGRPPLHDGD